VAGAGGGGVAGEVEGGVGHAAGAAGGRRRDEQGRTRFEAVANGDGPAMGRELEIARLLEGGRGRG
jgi:hypothetical protein